MTRTTLLDTVTPGSGGPPPAGGSPMRLSVPAIYYDALHDSSVWAPLGLEGRTVSDRARRVVELWASVRGGAWRARHDVPTDRPDTGAPPRMTRVMAWFPDSVRDALRAACHTIDPAPTSMAEAFRAILGGYLSLSPKQAARLRP